MSFYEVYRDWLAADMEKHYGDCIIDGRTFLIPLVFRKILSSEEKERVEAKNTKQNINVVIINTIFFQYFAV